VSAPGFHRRLGATTDLLMRRLAQAATAAGVDFSTNHVCGMFGLFFSGERRVDSFAKVMACDDERFRRFFHGMLDRGVYLAPSAYEAGFVSAMHTQPEIDATVAAAAEVFAGLRAGA